MQTYTVDDYEKLSGEDRWELIKGVFHMFMAPAPMRRHQDISGNLYNELTPSKKRKKYKIYFAPFDVELSKDTVVQPDICLISDFGKLTEKRCVGSPDLIIEILSKSSERRDCVDKLDIYEQFKVKEYWIVTPNTETVSVYVLGEDEEYMDPVRYAKTDSIHLSFDADVTIDLNNVFDY